MSDVSIKLMFRLILQVVPWRSKVHMWFVAWLFGNMLIKLTFAVSNLIRIIRCPWVIIFVYNCSLLSIYSFICLCLYVQGLSGSTGIKF